MKTLITVIIIIILAVLGYYLWDGWNMSEETGNSNGNNSGMGTTLPTFDDYKISEVYSGSPASPDFSTNPDAENFKTVITEGAKKGPNLAGHYTVVSWGCGTSCQSSAIIDAKTGDIVEYGIISAYGISVRKDSALFIVNPEENIPDLLLEEIKNSTTSGSEHYPLGSIPSGADYYVFENGKLKFLDRYSFGNDSGTMCAQVITPARNPVTEEVVEFPTPCSIPFGWEALETGEGVL